MLKKYKIYFITASVCLITFTLLGMIAGRVLLNEQTYKNLAILTEVLELVEKNYVEPVDLPKLYRGALTGLMESLDPECTYLTPEEYQAFTRSPEEESGDIGVEINKKSGFDYARIVRVLPNSPAVREGLQPGDWVRAVDRLSTQKLSLWSIRRKLRGPIDSSVILSITRKEKREAERVTLKREKVSPERVSYRIFEEGIGYFRIPNFLPGVSGSVAQELQSLQESGVDSLLIDLRGNIRGQLDEVIAIADMLLDRGEITSLKMPGGIERSYPAKEETTLYRGKLFLLLNNDTCNWGEILAAAIKDNKRGELIGEKTFGRGSLQQIIPLEDGSALRLSVGMFLTPEKAPIEGKGVTPHLSLTEGKIKEIAERRFVPDDPQLNKVLSYIATRQ
ncbi:MAG: S41 family peptidase [Acidobacteriota bacterium]